MKADKNILQLLQGLKLPQQDTSSLSFCNSHKASVVDRWAQALPATRVSQTSAMLYQALPEINQLKTRASNRLQMLESLRPYVQQCIEGLSKNFLNQPLILPQGAMKTAVVAQALQKHMSNGYSLCARDFLLRPEKGQVLEQALHRAITGLGLQLLRSLQLYTAPPPQLWSECHTLFRLAEAAGVTREAVADPLLVSHKATTIEQAYLRILLFSCSNANQLNQTEVANLYRILESWTSLIQLTPAATSQSIFCVNLASNSPPGQPLDEHLPDGDPRSLNVSALVSELEQLESGNNNHKIERPSWISEHLFQHCLELWRNAHKRLRPRQPANGSIEAVVGLTHLHYHLAGEQAFPAFLQQACHQPSSPRYQPQLNGSDSQDPWGKVFEQDLEEQPGQTAQTSAEAPPVHQLQVLDSSAGGYRLLWQDNIPVQVKTGELLGLRDPINHQWRIGVIRWARQQRNTTQLGIQLLAPNAQPHAVQPLKRDGELGEFMRALLLPALKNRDQAETIITAAMPFQAHQKVRMNHHDQLETALLSQCVFSTSAIKQFLFRYLETAGAQAADVKDTMPPSFPDSQWES